MAKIILGKKMILLQRKLATIASNSWKKKLSCRQLWYHNSTFSLILIYLEFILIKFCSYDMTYTSVTNMIITFCQSVIDFRMYLSVYKEKKKIKMTTIWNYELCTTNGCFATN